MNTFNPKIDRSLFKETIIKKQNNEGNNGKIVNHIQAEIDASEGSFFYDAFIKICSNYHITIATYQEENDVFKIALHVNGREMYFITYKDRNKDITIGLAEKMYSLLWEEIRNRLFIDTVKNNF